MKLYYHKTDGGAEYLASKKVKGTRDEGDMHFTVLRIDGGEIEIYNEDWWRKQLGIDKIIRNYNKK